MTAALLALITQVGAPFLLQILGGRIGSANASLVTDAISAIAQAAGVAPEGLDALIASDPAKVSAAIQQAEQNAPELIALYAKGVDYQAAQLAAEADEPMWMRAWRPIGMYLIFFLWAWEIVIHHVLNAWYKIALPNADMTSLTWLTGVYFALLMGGHTVKDFVAKKWGSAA